MEIYETTSKIGDQLRAKADQNNLPLGGSIELLPLCNMNCKMCYVRMSKEEMDRQGSMLSCDEWLHIAHQAKEMGVLYFLITGGEPLLYPEFKRLYTSIIDMGFVVTLNTNGTLINEEWADFFRQHQCSRINITLYGKDDKTYSQLCNNPKGYSQVMHAVELLQERDIPFRLHSSITKDNVDELEELYQIANEKDIYLRAASYMFPTVRIDKDIESQDRLGPEEAAQAQYLVHQLMRTEEEMKQANTSTLASLHLPPKFLRTSGFICHAAHSGFWINWQGEMMPCGMMNGPKYNLLENSFEECWNKLIEDNKVIHYPKECINCGLQNICQICPASLIAETGSYEKKSDYLCRFTKEMFRLMMENVSPEEQKIHNEFLENYDKNSIY
ncbi:MAG: radical SAM protein, partial [Erysipelotrichaceae bacterium]|nr:radical SAM protein [Erysipelotrichaceae bacterium]